ncbi:hypothetical protein ACQKC5_18775 [Shewanella baltica]|jgi:hypothetical protein|uniref:hypothetical protein n=1 Tax=Shewanella baltica TaxID=62322 RepID=UPI003CFC6BDD
MKAFLKRWYAEFKKDREIRQSTLLPTMSLKAYGAAFQNSNPKSKRPGCYRDENGNPDPCGEDFW